MTWGYPEEDRPQGGGEARHPGTPGARQGGTPTKTKRMGEIKHVFEYHDEDGTLLFQVVKDDKKDFYPRRPNKVRDPQEPAWTYGLGDVKRVLYRLPEVKSAVLFKQRVFVVEGEKDADTLASLGFTATTNPGGVGMGWTPLHLEEIKGATDVVILPDNDDPGRKHAEKVKSLLTDHVGRVRIITLPDLPPKGDVTDWILSGRTKDELVKIVDAGPLDRGWSRSTESLNGTVTKVDWIVENIFARPSLAMVSGDADSFKSWALTQLCMCAPCGWMWFSKFKVNGTRSMLVSSDEDKAETMRKVAWLTRGAAATEKDHAKMGEGFILWTDDMPFDDEPTFQALIEDVRDFKPDIIVIDHLRVTFDGDENSSEFARKIKMRGRAIHRAHPCAVIWVHHVRKLQKEQEMNKARQRVRGTGGLVQSFDHHLAFQREEDRDVATVTVDRQKKGKRMAPFSVSARFQDHEDMAHVQFEGDAESSAGNQDTPGTVLEFLRGHPWACTIQEVQEGCPGLARSTLKRALLRLELDRLTLVEGNSRKTTHRARETTNWSPEGPTCPPAHIRPKHVGPDVSQPNFLKDND